MFTIVVSIIPRSLLEFDFFILVLIIFLLGFGHCFVNFRLQKTLL